MAAAAAAPGALSQECNLEEGPTRYTAAAAATVAAAAAAAPQRCRSWGRAAERSSGAHTTVPYVGATMFAAAAAAPVPPTSETP